MQETPSTHNSTDQRCRAYAAAGVLIRDDAGNILMIETTYKKPLEIPGGYIETGETPDEACRREVWEELGINIELGELLVVDWAPAETEGDKVLFVFDGGTLSPEQLASIRIGTDEVKAYDYYPISVVKDRTPARLYRRLAHADSATTTRYLQHGERIHTY